MREAFVNEWHIDRPINVDVGDVYSLRAKVASHDLGKAAHSEFSRTERRRSRIRLDPRRRAGEENHATARFEHGWHNLFCGEECPKSVNPPSILEGTRL